MAPGRTRRGLGNFGEAAAAAHLVRQGYTLLERQWRSSQRAGGGTGTVAGEIDLVARHEPDGCLVFVEVRTRSSATYGYPEESLTPAKRARLVALALAYLVAHGLAETTTWRIDVIAVHVDAAGRIGHLHHIPHAIEG